MSRRPPGRPRLVDNEPSVNVHFRLSGSEYDQTYARAQADRVTVGDYIRRVVRAAHVREDPPKR